MKEKISYFTKALGATFLMLGLSLGIAALFL